LLFTRAQLAGYETQVGFHLVRTLEPFGPIDDSRETRRGDRSHARSRAQPSHRWILVGDLLYVLGGSRDLPIQGSHQFQDRGDLTLKELGDLEFTGSFDKARGSARPNSKTFPT